MSICHRIAGFQSHLVALFTDESIASHCVKLNSWDQDLSREKEMKPFQEIFAEYLDSKPPFHPLEFYQLTNLVHPNEPCVHYSLWTETVEYSVQ